MNLSEFQIESINGIDSAQIEDPANALIRLESFEACLESLVLGFRLRGWLTDSEKQALDCLAPNHHICFMMKGEEYLHPVGCELFAHETIRSSQSIPGEALFQHRWDPETGSTRGAYSIHSARIGSDGDSPVTLGLFGPEADALAIQLKERFGRLIEMARRAWQIADETLGTIRDKFDEETAYLLVNRCSGRIVHASVPALTLLDCPAEQMIDREFTKAMTGFKDLVRNHPLRMTRFNDGPYMLASLEIGAATSGLPEKTDRLNTEIYHKLRNKLTGILSASEYMAGVNDETALSEIAEIGQMIVEETQLAERIITRMQLLETIASSETTANSLNRMIRLVVGRLALETPEQFTIRFDPPADEFSVMAPSNGLATLIETIALAHVELGATHLMIKATAGVDGAVLVVSSDTVQSGPGLPTLWRTYTARLSQLMDLPCDCSCDPTTGAITTLEIPIE